MSSDVEYDLWLSLVKYLSIPNGIFVKIIEKKRVMLDSNDVITIRNLVTCTITILNH